MGGQQTRPRASSNVWQRLLRFIVVATFITGCRPPSAAYVPQDDPLPPTAPPVDLPANAPEGWIPESRVQRCSLPPAPPLGAMTLETVVDASALNRPLWVGISPVDAFELWILEQGGRILGKTRDGSLKTLLDLSVSRIGNEEGLLGMAFDPNFSTNPFVYLYYSASNPRRSVISRFSFDQSEDSIVATSEEELLVVEQPFGNHNGGDIHFGPDNFLYISLGDGGGAGDPFGHGQDTTTLHGSVLRIDLSENDPSCMRAYRIPEDNPFAASGCGANPNEPRPEIWAWGLRNVWRMSFDNTTGLLWAGDVGQDQKEEISILEQGFNYGWKPVEADICYQPECRLNDFAPPVYSYPHTEGQSVTGGLVYRGSQLPELWGQYVFGDYESGRIWSLDQTGEVELLSESRRKITSFGMSPNGALLVASFNGGIERLVRSDPDPGLPSFPRQLSETGCVSMSLEAARDANLLPYFVNYPFWSDGLSKTRYVALPEDGAIQFVGANPAVFPLGTVVVKNFFTSGANGQQFPIETRLIHREETEWSAFTYAWNADGSEAELVETPRTVDVFVHGTNVQWPLLSRGQCDKCHVQDKGYALGLSVEQLTRSVRYNNTPTSQLQAWVDAGLASVSGTLPSAFPAPSSMPNDLDRQARTYLHVNCASCHQPDGPGDAEIDLRYQTRFALMGLCNIVSDRDTLNIADGLLLKPGQPEASVLYERMLRRDKHRMPPLGSDLADADGLRLIGDWIRAMETCPTN